MQNNIDVAVMWKYHIFYKNSQLIPLLYEGDCTHFNPIIEPW